MPVFNPPLSYDMISVLPETHGVQRQLFRYYSGNPRGLSVVKVAGHYATVDTPYADTLIGTEGVDWFLGGHGPYTVSGTVAIALVADGYGAYTSGVSFRASTSSGAASSSAAVTIPASVQTGDFLLASFFYVGGAGGSDPAGWTMLTPFSAGGGSIVSRVGWKIAAPGDAGSVVTWTAGAGAQSILILHVYVGVNAASPIDTSGGASVNSGTSIGVATLSPTSYGNEMVAAFFGYWRNPIVGTPSIAGNGINTVRETRQVGQFWAGSADEPWSTPGTPSMGATVANASAFQCQIFAIRP